MSRPISVSELFLRLQPQLVSLSQTLKKSVKEHFNRAQECFGEVKNSIIMRLGGVKNSINVRKVVMLGYKFQLF